MRLHRPSFRSAPEPILRHPLLFAVMLVAVAACAGVVVSAAMRGGPAPQAAAPAYSYSSPWTLLELQRHIEAGTVDAVTRTAGGPLQPDQLVARTTSGEQVPISLNVTAADAVSALSAMGYGRLLTDEAAAAVETGGSGGGSMFGTILFLGGSAVLLAVVLGLLTRRGTALSGLGSGSVAASTAPAGDHVHLDDVAGCDEAKTELVETIEFLRAPDRFVKLGAKSPRGVLLWGPPGTGKTMLAKAVAGEAGVPFYHASGAQFVEKFVGVGASRVRSLFAEARKGGRGVIFIDEFDALARARGGPNSHEEREQTLNQLLVEMDGFDTTSELVVIAATNRYDTLDAAILRPGRFTRKIHVGLPDVDARREILAIHGKGKPLDETVDLESMARRSAGFSGADLADLLNEAAIFAGRRGAEEIGSEDVRQGWLKVAVGTSRARSMDERERAIIAAHEAGHAICGRVSGEKRRVEEISLFAHGDALGVTVSSQEDNALPSQSDLRARLVALMGGRAAEDLLFEEITGGASNDFEKANRLATSMVTRWGMGLDPEADEAGPTGRGMLSFHVNRGDSAASGAVGAAQARAIGRILDEAYAAAKAALEAEMETLLRVSAYLVEHERIDGDQFADVYEGRLEPSPEVAASWRPESARPRPVELSGSATGTAVQPTGERAKAGRSKRRRRGAPGAGMLRAASALGRRFRGGGQAAA